MTRPPYAIPLRPDFAAARDRPSASLVRACLAMARSVHDRDRLGAAETARRAWSDDRATLEIVQRAVSSAATSTTSGWASQLAATAVADLISTLGPASAGSQLIAQALNLEFGSAASIRCRLS